MRARQGLRCGVGRRGVVYLVSGLAGLALAGVIVYELVVASAPGRGDSTEGVRGMIERLANAYPEPVKVIDVIIWQPDPDRSACREIRGLGRKAVPYLIEGLYHENFKVRRGCAEMLSVIPAKEGIEALIGCIGEDAKTMPRPSLSVVQKALHTLTGHSTPRAPGPLWDRDEMTMRRIWGEWWRRYGDRLVNTAAGVGLRQDDGSVLPLPVGQSYPDGQIPHRVADVLPYLKHPEAPIRESAARDLGKIGDASAVSALIDALHDKHWLVRRAAAQALGAIGSPESLQALEVALQDSNSFVRHAAAEAIEKVKADRAILKHDHVSPPLAPPTFRSSEQNDVRR